MNRPRAAWIVAIAADALQLGLFPLTGTLSTWVNAPLDLLAMALLWRLVGWHWALLPSFLVELAPFTELVPTWTGAVFLIDRKRKAALAATEAAAPRP